MQLEPVLITTDSAEAELARSLLESHGLHPFVQGGQSGGLMAAGFHGLIEQRLLVPGEELSRAKAILEQSQVVFDGTQPTGESLEGAVCPVHEGPAVATCSRCGTFLCAQCGSLGDEPVCEQCVARPEPAQNRAPVMRAIAKGYVILWVLGVAGGVLITALAVLYRLLR